MDALIFIVAFIFGLLMAPVLLMLLDLWDDRRDRGVKWYEWWSDDE